MYMSTLKSCSATHVIRYIHKVTCPWSSKCVIINRHSNLEHLQEFAKSTWHPSIFGKIEKIVLKIGDWGAWLLAWPIHVCVIYVAVHVCHLEAYFLYIFL
jgi:hypothetical protein